MVVRVPKDKKLLFYQLIDRDLYERYPQFKRKKFVHFLPLSTAASLLHVTERNLLSICYKDKKLLALVLPTGEIYLHPTRVLRLVALTFKRLIKKCISDPTYEVPEKFQPPQKRARIYHLQKKTQ